MSFLAAEMPALLEQPLATRRNVYRCYAPFHFAWGDDASWDALKTALQDAAWSPTPQDCPVMGWERLEAWYTATYAMYGWGGRR
jgi:hypothetical protein